MRRSEFLLILAAMWAGLFVGTCTPVWAQYAPGIPDVPEFKHLKNPIISVSEDTRYREKVLKAFRVIPGDGDWRTYQDTYSDLYGLYRRVANANSSVTVGILIENFLKDRESFRKARNLSFNEEQSEWDSFIFAETFRLIVINQMGYPGQSSEHARLMLRFEAVMRQQGAL